MKEKIKIGSKVLIFTAVLAIMLHYSAYLFVSDTYVKGQGKTDVFANAILSEKDNDIEVLFMGDSEAYSAFSPLAMYERRGFTSYVLATSAQPLYYTQSLLERTLKNQKPKVLVLETNLIYRNIVAADSIAHKISDLFPIFELHDRWKSVSLKANQSNNKSKSNTIKGYYFSKAIDGVKDLSKYMAPSNEIRPIESLNRGILDQIVEICRDNDIKVIFVSTPSTVNWNMKKHNGIAKYTKEKDITYIDMNLLTLEEAIDWQRDTRDEGDHLNYFGAMKVSNYIADYLTEHFDLHDRRHDISYYHWQDALNKYNEMIKDELKKETRG